MANLTWTVVTAAGTITQDSPTLTDPNMTRFTDWAWVHYPQYEADGVTLKTKNNTNLAAAVRDWMTSQWNGTKANVLRYEQVAAAQAASDAVTDIG